MFALEPCRKPREVLHFPEERSHVLNVTLHSPRKCAERPSRSREIKHGVSAARNRVASRWRNGDVSVADVVPWNLSLNQAYLSARINIPTFVDEINELLLRRRSPSIRIK